MTQPKSNRRKFLKSAAFAGTAPLILPAQVWAAPPSERKTMGFIGMGKQSGGLLNGFINSENVQVLAVCDVDTTRREAAAEKVRKYYTDRPEKGSASDLQAYNEFEKITGRDDIDAVCIATPDHWHAVITLAALGSDQDVYCEKPLTHNIHEAIEVMKEVDARGRVLQTGSMQRSMKEFRVACELVQNGHIGKVERVEVSFGDPGVVCDLPEEAAEPGLDWDRWLGPAQKRPFNSVLSPRGVHGHFPNWRAYKEFGGGMVTDWGAHHLDITQWGLGTDLSGPIEARPPEKKDAKRGASLVYENGAVVTHADGTAGVRFHGTEGIVEVGRGRIAFSSGGETVAQFMSKEDGSINKAVHVLETEVLGDDRKVRLYESPNHLKDFLACMESRQKPITHEGIGAGSAICCHLMNLAYWNHQKIQWDPAANAFAGSTGDPAWLTRDYRSPWTV